MRAMSWFLKYNVNLLKRSQAQPRFIVPKFIHFETIKIVRGILLSSGDYYCEAFKADKALTTWKLSGWIQAKFGQ